MGISNLQGPSAYDSDADVNELLERLDLYIVTLARTKVPRNIVRPEMLADEIEELAQKVRIKLWLALRKQRVDNLKAYIHCIVYTEVIDMVRRHRPMLCLPLDEDGELYQGNLIFASGEGMHDPGHEVEQAEERDNSMQGIFEAIIRLPPRQQYAMICSLKEQLDGVLPVIDTLKDQLTDLEAVNWPKEKNELQSLRSSLSIARKKLLYLNERKRV
jgi:DNA-directed RNA polymerase specialized sigma24 family protein